MNIVAQCFREIWSRHIRCAVVGWVFAAFICLVTIAAGRPGTVEFSNGETMEGDITLTPGKDFKIHDGKLQRTFPLEVIKAIRVAPEKEDMERKWRFVEAGKTKKEFWGDPFPVRHLRATAELAGGEIIEGHLYTTVLYVNMPGGARKVILRAKERGKEGETLDDLVYARRIDFADAGEAATGRLTVAFSGAQPAELAILTFGELARIEASRAGAEWQLAAPLGTRFFTGLRTPEKIVIGWSATPDPETERRVRAAMADMRDFFDNPTLLGVFRDDTDIYTLILMHRSGGTSLGETRSQPWRVVISRWKTDRDNEKLMLAGRGYFFRGILGKDATPPPVEISEKLWALQPTDGVLTVPE